MYIYIYILCIYYISEYCSNNSSRESTGGPYIPMALALMLGSGVFNPGFSDVAGMAGISNMSLFWLKIMIYSPPLMDLKINGSYTIYYTIYLIIMVSYNFSGQIMNISLTWIKAGDDFSYD